MPPDGYPAFQYLQSVRVREFALTCTNIPQTDSYKIGILLFNIVPCISLYLVR